jgi:hypothetical protein
LWTITKQVSHKHVEEYRRRELLLVQKAQWNGNQQKNNLKKYILPFMIVKFFGNQHSYNKINFAQHTKFLEDLVLYIAKGYILSIVLCCEFMDEVHDFKIMSTCCVFISTSMVINVLPKIVEKTKKKYVLLSFTSCITCTWSFNI